MALSKPPTMEELVDFDLVDLYEKLANSTYLTSKSIYAPYIEKCNVDDGDYFMFFMLKLLQNRYWSALPMYLKEHNEQPSLGEKLLRLCFELRDVIPQNQCCKLMWEENSVTLYCTSCYYITTNQRLNIYKIPINKTNYTKEFPYLYITFELTQ